ncbi:hypothetical protein P8A22_37140 [Streptomyces laculatispora]|uniref:Uncharacterized protein n=1 Tax=Streptomyces laculatispora TaxID=887464 RepID=A0ABY9IE02_9ACTN|nr:hypothetical protein [Streptomyces laculatispora]WLQ45025.1 hypothetical protein P8A22_37140 [Streptomyces laculatispora]
MASAAVRAGRSECWFVTPAADAPDGGPVPAVQPELVRVERDAATGVWRELVEALPAVHADSAAKYLGVDADAASLYLQPESSAAPTDHNVPVERLVDDTARSGPDGAARHGCVGGGEASTDKVGRDTDPEGC